MQVVLVGSLETATKGTDGKLHTVAGSPFREVRSCWEDLTHVNFHEYHVTNPRDLTYLKTMRRGQPGRDWESVRIRDAHVTVRTAQLLPLLGDALAALDKDRDAAQLQEE